MCMCVCYCVLLCEVQDSIEANERERVSLFSLKEIKSTHAVMRSSSWLSHAGLLFFSNTSPPFLKLKWNNDTERSS